MSQGHEDRERLIVVMPVYNERQAIAAVLAEWLDAIAALDDAEATLLLVDDGSTDGTADIARELAARRETLVVVRKDNSGHGPSCLYGYAEALRRGAQWVLQVDSDGQCDPRYLARFWQQRGRGPLHYGRRRERGDGRRRALIQAALRLLLYARSGVYVRDANVPYRLMSAETTRWVLARVPTDFLLSNVAVALLHQRHHGIYWHDIAFRPAQRAGKHPLRYFARHARRLLDDLRRLPT
ncbi:MAG: glycosyltransferase family 2 protein [Myxococcales bacterium]|nr:glycosyltransferase family 2 protein [Myxococcales bacterium]